MDAHNPLPSLIAENCSECGTSACPGSTKVMLTSCSVSKQRIYSVHVPSGSSKPQKITTPRTQPFALLNIATSQMMELPWEHTPALNGTGTCEQPALNTVLVEAASVGQTGDSRDRHVPRDSNRLPAVDSYVLGI